MILGGCVTGGLFVVLVGGPIWLGMGYAGVGLAIPIFRALRDRPSGFRRPGEGSGAHIAQRSLPSAVPQLFADPLLFRADVQRVVDRLRAIAAVAVAAPPARTADASEAAAGASERAAQSWPASDVQRVAEDPVASAGAAPSAPPTRTGDRSEAAGGRVSERAAPCWPASEVPRVAEDPVASAGAAPSTLPAAAPARTEEKNEAAAGEAPERAATGRAGDVDVRARARPLTGNVGNRVSAIGYVFSRPDSAGAEQIGADDSIKALCAAHGLTLASIARDVEGPRGDGGARPALRWALDQLVADLAQTLVVARLADLSDSAPGLSALLRWFDEQGRTLIALDLGLDTSTEGGRLAASTLVQVGGWEHERISARTRRGLEAARARGTSSTRTTVADVPELRDRIRRMRAEGMTLQAIADVLNAEGVPTLRGGVKWRPSSVQSATGYRRPSSKRLDLPQGGSRRE